MKLTIRYDEEEQCIELNAEDTQKLWISLSLEGEELSQKEKEEKIQKKGLNGFLSKIRRRFLSPEVSARTTNYNLMGEKYGMTPQ